MNEANRHFFRFKWRRMATTIFCFGWTVVEWVSGEPFWGIIAAAITFYCLWNFFYKYDESQNDEG